MVVDGFGACVVGCGEFVVTAAGGVVVVCFGAWVVVCGAFVVVFGCAACVVAGCAFVVAAFVAAASVVACFVVAAAAAVVACLEVADCRFMCRTLTSLRCVSASPLICTTGTMTSGVDSTSRAWIACKSRVLTPSWLGRVDIRSTTSNEAIVARIRSRNPKMIVGLLRKGWKNSLRRFFLLLAPEAELDNHTQVYHTCPTYLLPSCLLLHLFKQSCTPDRPSQL